METILMLLCVAGLSFAIRQVDGPFRLVAKLRNLLVKIPLLGPVFFEAINCDFCLGFWSGVMVFFVANSFSIMPVGDLLVWAFGSAMFNLLFSRIVDKLI